MKRLSTLSLLIFLFVLSCSSPESDSSRGLTPANGGRNYGGVFRVNESEYIKNLYPLTITDVYSYRVASQVYEGLFKFDDRDLSVEPSLIERYEMSDDNTTYTFYLKKGVLFHDDPCFPDGKGREMTAQDVAFSFTQVCTQNANNQGFQIFDGILKGANAYYEASADGTPDFSVSGITVIDDYTIQLELVEPYSLFTTNLARPFAYIYPPEALEKYGLDMRIHPVGTGPFYLSTVEEDINLILKKNTNYYGVDEFDNQLPFLEAINIQFIKDKKSELFEFKKGNLDMIYRLPTEYIIEILEETAKGEDGEYAGYELQREPEMVTQFLVFNTADGIFESKDIRKAFSFAIDREKILNFVLNGEGFAPGKHGITPPVFEDYPIEEIDGFSFNPDSAKFYLRKAGFNGGQNFPDVKFYLNAEGARNTNVAIEIQKQLSDNLNINVELEILPFAQLAEKSYHGNYNMMRLAWYADFPSAENFLWMFYGKDVPAGSDKISYPNIARYQNPQFDLNYEKALKAASLSEANKFFRKAENIMVDDAPIIVLWYDEGYRLVQSYVRNFPNNPMQYRDFTEVYFEKPEKLN